MFSEQERRAFDLGHRMAQTEFALQDNPYVGVHPRLAHQWMQGYVAANALKGLTSALSRPRLVAGTDTVSSS
jgi:hypothetical protein